MHISIRTLLVVAAAMLAIVSPSTSNSQTDSYMPNARDVFKAVQTLAETQKDSAVRTAIQRVVTYNESEDLEVETRLLCDNMFYSIITLNRQTNGKLVPCGYISYAAENEDGSVTSFLFSDIGLDGTIDYYETRTAKKGAPLPEITAPPMRTFYSSQEFVPFIEGETTVSQKEAQAKYNALLLRLDACVNLENL